MTLVGSVSASLVDPVSIALFLLALASDRGDAPGDMAARIRAGDEEAFRSFFDANHEAVYSYLRGRGLSPEFAADAVQQAFIVLWEKRASLRSGTSLRAFVFRIAYRRALNEIRAARHDGLDESVPEGSELSAGLAVVTDAASGDVLLAEHFEKAVNALPEKRRLVFELCFIHGYTYREAAAILEVSIKTVENQMGHALKALRSALAAFR